MAFLDDSQRSQIGARVHCVASSWHDWVEHFATVSHFERITILGYARRTRHHEFGLRVNWCLCSRFSWIRCTLLPPQNGPLQLTTQLLTAWHEHLTFRAGAMVRGGLISLIYRKTLRMPTKDLQSSSAVALMGNDVETLTERLSNLLVESWANTLTVGIAMWLLYVQLGIVFIAPIIMAFSKFMANKLAKMC